MQLVLQVRLQLGGCLSLLKLTRGVDRASPCLSVSSPQASAPQLTITPPSSVLHRHVPNGEALPASTQRVSVLPSASGLHLWGSVCATVLHHSFYFMEKRVLTSKGVLGLPQR